MFQVCRPCCLWKHSSCLSTHRSVCPCLDSLDLITPHLSLQTLNSTLWRSMVFRLAPMFIRAVYYCILICTPVIHATYTLLSLQLLILRQWEIWKGNKVLNNKGITTMLLVYEIKLLVLTKMGKPWTVEAPAMSCVIPSSSPQVPLTYIWRVTS